MFFFTLFIHQVGVVRCSILGGFLPSEARERQRLFPSQATAQHTLPWTFSIEQNVKDVGGKKQKKTFCYRTNEKEKSESKSGVRETKTLSITGDSASQIQQEH